MRSERKAERRAAVEEGAFFALAPRHTPPTLPEPPRYKTDVCSHIWINLSGGGGYTSRAVTAKRSGLAVETSSSKNRTPKNAAVKKEGPPRSFRSSRENDKRSKGRSSREKMKNPLTEE